MDILEIVADILGDLESGPEDVNVRDRIEQIVKLRPDAVDLISQSSQLFLSSPLPLPLLPPVDLVTIVISTGSCSINVCMNLQSRGVCRNKSIGIK